MKVFSPKYKNTAGLTWVNGEPCNLQAFLLVIYFWNGQIKEDELIGTCGAHWTEDKCVQNFDANSEGKKPLR